MISTILFSRSRSKFRVPAFSIASSAGLLAQSNEPNPGAAAGGCAICGSILLIPIIIIVLNIALLVWVARDAKARCMDSAVLWMILVMVTSVIGLVIYLFARPQGNLVQCSKCHNQRLQASALCP